MNIEQPLDGALDPPKKLKKQLLDASAHKHFLIPVWICLDI